MDEVAGLAQAMSTAHHQEVLDEYMNDSNWRKVIRMADSLCKKWSRAKQGLSETMPAFEQLTECLEPSLVQEWTAQERVAMENRGDHLKIYEATLDKLPTLADIRLRLSEAEVRYGNLSGSVSALMEGLTIERSQLLLQSHRNELLERRRKLEARIAAYEQRMAVIIKPDDDTKWLAQDPHMDFDSDTSEDALESHPDGWFTPEHDRITLPSALAPGEIERLSLKSIAMIEAELRKGQVTDALEGLRLALGEKSLCFRTEVRNADSQRTTHRAWDNVHKLDAEARKCRATYRHAWSALERLSNDPDTW
ncbi:hypothetical protein BJV78DRAFT_1286968 [Lactifluus subvellereus]|nr:hypothetical protein BJV78DRAFT_1286968 [Lactifluus subvellereus]